MDYKSVSYQNLVAEASAVARAYTTLSSQARSQGGGVGGVVRPPPVAHHKDFVPPFSNFVPPFSNFVPPFSNFVPPFSNFVPALEYVDDVTRAMSKGGGCLWMSKSGAFFKLMTSQNMRTSPRGGGAPGVPPIQVQTPPPGWLRAWFPLTN